MASKSSDSPPTPDEAKLKKGEMTGVARGPDVDSSFHVYEFDEPEAAEEKK